LGPTAPPVCLPPRFRRAAGDEDARRVPDANAREIGDRDRGNDLEMRWIDDAQDRI
jgi:hypothetical protein